MCTNASQLAIVPVFAANCAILFTLGFFVSEKVQVLEDRENTVEDAVVLHLQRVHTLPKMIPETRQKSVNALHIYPLTS